MTPKKDRPARAPWVAVLGPDGSGKSSVLRAAEGALRQHFPCVQVTHRRPPGLLGYKKAAGPVIDHYADPPYGPVLSVAKLLFRAAEWLAGYWARTRPQSRAGCLVIFDRHYLLDILVDPRRYRYGGPPGLARALARLVPAPDLVILLDAPPEVLFARKQEMTAEEVARQRAGYRALVDSLPRSRVLDASRPLEAVAAELVAIILSAPLESRDSAPVKGAPAAGRSEGQW